MNYIIFDLEFNQMFNSEINEAFIPFEIIQIGAVKLNAKLEVLDTFDTLVKPTIFNVVHPYISELTQITDSMVANCDTFPEVYSKFLNFMGPTEDATLVVWGATDIKEFIRNIEFHNLDLDAFPKEYMDLQEQANKVFKVRKGCKMGLKSAIEICNIPSDKELHNAYNDAYYTSKIFTLLYNKKLKSKTYILNKEKPKMEPKKKVDKEALLNQFEKMYGRELTSDEKAMIQLAYIMGKTNQFLK